MTSRLEIWKRYLSILINRNLHNCNNDTEQLSKTLFDCINFSLFDKWWFNKFEPFIKHYEVCIDKIEYSLSNQQFDEKYVPKMKKILFSEYVFAHGGTEHVDGIWEIIKSKRHVFMRCVDKKSILEYFPECLTEIVIGYMV